MVVCLTEEVWRSIAATQAAWWRCIDGPPSIHRVTRGAQGGAHAPGDPSLPAASLRTAGGVVSHRSSCDVWAQDAPHGRGPIGPTEIEGDACHGWHGRWPWRARDGIRACRLLTSLSRMVSARDGARSRNACSGTSEGTARDPDQGEWA